MASSPLRSPVAPKAVPQGLPSSLSSLLRERKRTFVQSRAVGEGSPQSPPQAKTAADEADETNITIAAG